MCEFATTRYNVMATSFTLIINHIISNTVQSILSINTNTFFIKNV